MESDSPWKTGELTLGNWTAVSALRSGSFWWEDRWSLTASPWKCKLPDANDDFGNEQRTEVCQDIIVFAIQGVQPVKRKRWKRDWSWNRVECATVGWEGHMEEQGGECQHQKARMGRIFYICREGYWSHDRWHLEWFYICETVLVLFLCSAISTHFGTPAEVKESWVRVRYRWRTVRIFAHTEHYKTLSQRGIVSILRIILVKEHRVTQKSLTNKKIEETCQGSQCRGFVSETFDAPIPRFPFHMCSTCRGLSAGCFGGKHQRVLPRPKMRAYGHKGE